MATELSIPRAVCELINLDSSAGAVKIRVYRSATALQDSPGGYVISRAKTRHGFSGDEGDDDTGYEDLSTTITQPSSSTLYVDQALTSQPTDTNVWYRVRGADNAGTPTKLGPWSNVLLFKKLNDRHVAIPSWPSNMRPGRGILRGLVDELQDSDVTLGLTWYEFRLHMAQVAESIYEKLLDQMPDGVVSELFRDPPSDLVYWFENEVVIRLLPYTTIQVAEMQERIPFYRATSDEARDALLSSGVIHSPGAPSIGANWGRLVR